MIRAEIVRSLMEDSTEYKRALQKLKLDVESAISGAMQYHKFNCGLKIMTVINGNWIVCEKDIIEWVKSFGYEVYTNGCYVHEGVTYPYYYIRW